LYCLVFNGRVLWSKPLDPRETRYGWGTSISPVLHGDRLFVVRDYENRSELIAFNKHTGEEVWQVEREEPTNFATPYVWQNAARTELVVPGRNQVRSYALDGRLLWWLKGLSTITIPTPFEADGLLYLAAGYVGDRENPNKPVYAVRPGGAGDLTLPEGERSSRFIAWMEPNAAPYNPSPLAYDGGLYVLWDFGFLSNRDAKTGVETYDKQRLRTNGTAAFTASPWAYRGRVFGLSEDGDTYVVKAGDQYQLERINSLDEMCMATPAIAGDRLFIRTATGLWCLREAE
jgi:outer membrane protein assembly factor BamB